MRKFPLILLGLVSLALLVMVWSFGRGLSDTDRQRITIIVQAETAESILEIELMRDGTVQVSTGVRRGGFDGGGNLFTLKRTFSGWKIVSRGAWMAYL